MKLYHATKLSNKDIIEELGLMPQETEKLSNSDDRILEVGVFGFTTIEDAEYFAKDNYAEYAIFEFEVEEESMVDDPEYDGEAKFVATDDYIKATLVEVF